MGAHRGHQPRRRLNVTREITLEASFSGPSLDDLAAGLITGGLGEHAQVKILSPNVVKLVRPGYPLDPAALVAQLAGVPFELAAFRAIHPTWLEPRSPAAPPRYGFADGHYFHGWACAFRGAGHDRLVSGRWLAFGPWKVHAGRDDMSLVQFHDLAAPAEVAREQCVVSHRWMGSSDEGGFIQRDPPLPERAPGDYVPQRRQLRIPVCGRTVTPREMLDVRTIVKLQALGPDRRPDTATFAFADEAEGRAHLHALWLRELECVTFVGGVETELTRAHAPTPTPPDWAR